MASTYRSRYGVLTPGQSRRRGVALTLAIVAHLLLILVLLRLAPTPFDPGRRGETLKTFAVAQGQKDRPRATPRKARAPQQARRAPTPAAAQPPSRVTVGPAVDASAIWALGKSVYRASDIAAIPSAKGSGEQVADAGGGDGGDSRPIGQGPGGRSLYAAQWYTEPTDAEMRTYMPKAVQPPATAMVMCQTAPRYRVENCRELEESPPGSGLMRAVRQAAWQFKVIPPRENGQPMIGAWVRIRFDITDGGIRIRK